MSVVIQIICPKFFLERHIYRTLSLEILLAVVAFPLREILNYSWMKAYISVTSQKYLLLIHSAKFCRGIIAMMNG